MKITKYLTDNNKLWYGFERGQTEPDYLTTTRRKKYVITLTCCFSVYFDYRYRQIYSHLNIFGYTFDVSGKQLIPPIIFGPFDIMIYFKIVISSVGNVGERRFFLLHGPLAIDKTIVGYKIEFISKMIDRHSLTSRSNNINHCSMTFKFCCTTNGKFLSVFYGGR